MKDKEKNFVSAVVYVHNAADRVEDFIKMLVETFQDNFEHSEIICVNDSSTDDSLNLIKKMSACAVSTNISVVNMSSFHGLEASMNAGIDLSIGDFVYEFDAIELNYDREVILGIYHRALEGYDIVSAVPDQKEKLTSRIFYKVFDLFSNFSYQMHTESFRILSRRVINRIGSMNKAVLYRKAVYASQGLRTDSVRYKTKKDTSITRDKLERKYRSGLAIDALILFTNLGYRFSILMTALMMCMSALMVLYSVVIFATSHPVAGWTTTILFLSIAFLGLFGILSIVIKYLQLLVNLTFKRKQYSVEGIEKLTK